MFQETLSTYKKSKTTAGGRETSMAVSASFHHPMLKKLPAAYELLSNSEELMLYALN